MSWQYILKQYSAITAFGESYKPNKFTNAKLPAQVVVYDLSQEGRPVFQENYQTVQEGYDALKDLANQVRFDMTGNDVNGHLISRKNTEIKLRYWITENGEYFNRQHDKEKYIRENTI
tara:strand:- start:916 stop:1269 length:354 start_codon:yes stop_codon:yes gene_type:complete